MEVITDMTVVSLVTEKYGHWRKSNACLPVVTSSQSTAGRKMLRSVKIHGTQSTVYATHRENLHATQPKVQH